MKVGLFGGSFNPIHLGHLILAEEAKEMLCLEKVIFIPSHTPPLKKSEDIADSHDRYEMVKLAIKENPSFSASDIEIRRGGTSYTIDTVRTLKKEMPNTEFVFLIGSDCLKSLYAWKDVEELFRSCHFVIVKRSKFPSENVPNGFEKLDIPQVDISSRELRKRLREGKSISYQVPKAVEHYILERKLYR